MDQIAENLNQVRARIARAAARSGRDPAQVRLIAVSKTHPAQMVRRAAQAGVTVFGENYVQEARAKMAQLDDLALEWHFIGRLQTNKAKDVTQDFALIHSVDRLKLAQTLDRRAGDKPVKVLVQVNLAEEETKGGVSEAQALDLIRAVAGLDKLEPRGLMVMPPFFDQPERARPFFARLRNLADKARQATGLELPELSMGMSGDFEVAVEEGATLVRVGTAIFGQRA
ncbi:MAG: YggS family pyridoxal phosphate-dependent enzyme [Deltaproteobacteria bacterium]|nr:YggS family pyridoxal phosphate-dependent enzyme [Deltaproteobacteria bacterium]